MVSADLSYRKLFSYEGLPKEPAKHLSHKILLAVLMRTIPMHRSQPTRKQLHAL